MKDAEGWGEWFQTIALVEGERIVGVVVYTAYSSHDIAMNIAFEAGCGFTRPYLRAIFGYPFNQLKVKRVSAYIASRNVKSRSLTEKVGFRQEGVMREALADDDLVIYGMLERECRWHR